MDLFKVLEDAFTINKSSKLKITDIDETFDWLIEYKKHLETPVDLQKTMEWRHEMSNLYRDMRELNEAKLKLMAQMAARNEESITKFIEDVTYDVLKYVSGDIKKLNLNKIYQSSQLLVHDIRTRRDWMNAFNEKLKEYEKLRKNERERVMQVLTELGRAILGRAIELCPYKTGLLRSSGTLFVFNDRIEIIFLAPYATYVHENLNALHPVGQAKFLELAVQEFLPNRKVWVEYVGESIVYVSIDINWNLAYKHYGSN